MNTTPNPAPLVIQTAHYLARLFEKTPGLNKIKLWLEFEFTDKATII
jgi:hypothetical protein